MKKILILFIVFFSISVNAQVEKILYKTDGTNVIEWENKLIDTLTYTRQVNEYWGDLFQKPTLQNGEIIEGWDAQDQADFDEATAQAVLDQDAHSQKNAFYVLDGKLWNKRIWDRVLRDYELGTITEGQFTTISEQLFDAILPLNYGLWKVAKARVDATGDPADPDLLAIKTKIQEIINDYITENY